MSSYNLMIHGNVPGSAECTKHIFMCMITFITLCVFDPNKYIHTYNVEVQVGHLIKMHVYLFRGICGTWYTS